MRIVNPYKATSGDSAINADRDLLHSGFDEGASACDKEWAEWIETFIYNEYGTIIIQDNCWQSRRKELGL
jgi:hypothetical protein